MFENYFGVSNLLLTKKRHWLRYFSANQIWTIFFNLSFVNFLLFFILQNLVFCINTRARYFPSNIFETSLIGASKLYTIFHLFLLGIHPITVFDLLKHPWHKLLELLIESKIFISEVVRAFHDAVECPHNEIVISSRLSILEDNIGIGEEVILNCTDIIYFFYDCCKFFVDFVWGSQGVFFGHIRQ